MRAGEKDRVEKEQKAAWKKEKEVVE